MARDIRNAAGGPEDLPLFAVDEPPRETARQRTRFATSDEAFRAVGGTDCARIVEYLSSSGPATCDELEERLSMTHQTASARVNELMRAGVVVAEGSRPTRSGRRARVWRLR